MAIHFVDSWFTSLKRWFSYGKTPELPPPKQRAGDWGFPHCIRGLTSPACMVWPASDDGSPQVSHPDMEQCQKKIIQTQMLHVWNIYLHLGDFWGKCW